MCWSQANLIFNYHDIDKYKGDEFGTYHISHVSLASFARSQQQYIKEANLLRMIMSYKTCHDVTSSSPHAVVNDVCLLLLSGQWTNLSSVTNATIYRNIASMWCRAGTWTFYVLCNNFKHCHGSSFLMPFLYDKCINI